MSFDFTPRDMMSIRHLRFRRLWISVGLVLLVLVAVGSMITFPSSFSAYMLHDKVLHTLAYASLMGWFSQIYRHDLTRLVLVVGLVSMGICIEFLQALTPTRQFDVLDMVANTSGVVLAWALAYTWVGEILAWIEGQFCRKVLRA
jgi:VanZ family protein